MKKHKSLVGLLFVILTVISVNVLDNTVQADNKLPGCNDDDFSVSAPEVEGNEVVIKNEGKKGIWEIKLSPKANPSGTYTLDAVNGNGELRIPFNGTVVIGAEGDVEESESIATLTQSDGSCDATTNKVWYKLYAFEEPSGPEKNDNWDNACQQYRTWANGAGAESYARESLGYCYEEYTSTNYTHEQVIKMWDEIKDLWDLMKDLNDDYTEDVENAPEGYKKVNNINLKNLTCDAFNRNKNEEKYSYSKTVQENDVCKVVCREDLTVVYDAPISVKAGLCFTYTVEVKSKVKCSSKVNIKAKPKKQTACIPKSTCKHKDGKTSPSGGPNEDFDACVSQCDGGKYTQKCINKCYKEVYGNVKTTTMISYNDILAEKMKSSCGALNKYFTKYKGKLSAKEEEQFKADIKEVQQAVLGNPSGHYTRKNGVIKWINDYKSDNCYWSQYGSYYFATFDRARRTITHDSKHGLNQSYGGISAKNYTVDTNKEGFKKAYRGTCSAKCVWSGCKGREVDQQKLDKQWEDEINAYKKKIAECKKYAKCEEKTTKFTMSVLPSSKNGSWINYEQSNTPNDKAGDTCKNPVGPDTIINTQSGACYGKGSASTNTACSNDNENDYRTVINFPGSWQDTKNATWTYKKPQIITGYEHTPNEFCPSNNFRNVNSNWWAWELDSNKSNYTQAQLNSIKNNLTYNIKASATNFGLFGWNINIKCFYAIYNGEVKNSPPVKVDPNCDLDSKNCVTTDITSYTYKAAALDELFAGDKETSNKDVAGRETGWNWSCEATDLMDPQYPIAPTVLISDIQSKGDSIYKNDAEYLDYSIELTPSTINKIKSINKQQKNFLNYTGNTAAQKNQDTRSVYRSQFLDSLGTGVVKVRYTNTIGCNNREGNGCLTKDMVNQNQDYCLTARNSLGK